MYNAHTSAALVEADELVKEVVASSVVVILALVVLEEPVKRRLQDFLGDQVDLREGK